MDKFGLRTMEIVTLRVRRIGKHTEFSLPDVRRGRCVRDRAATMLGNYAGCASDVQE